MKATLKPLRFRGDSDVVLAGFRKDVRREMGFNLHLVQSGGLPDEFKTMSIVGAGVQEIRVKDPNGIFRAFYVAKFADAVYVLHCFEKKTQKTN